MKSEKNQWKYFLLSILFKKKIVSKNTQTDSEWQTEKQQGINLLPFLSFLCVCKL